MKKVHVNLGKRSYDIFIGYGITKGLAKLLPRTILSSPILVVTNKKVRRIAGKVLLDSLKSTKGRIQIKEIPDSERAKSFQVYAQIILKLSEMGKGAKPAIIALGGGVVGDVTGFAAATYRRGIPYVHVPTTLLAQVDSSIGGKVAIDLPQAKNLVGNFYQPKAVICDLSFLKTLPKKEIRNGLAEVIKYGIIYDERFFKYIANNIQNISKLKKDTVEYVVWRSASIKAKIVSRDEYDTSDVRVILNFGHTFAHAIEAAFKYSKAKTHGESVAIGMLMACETASRLNMLGVGDVSRVKEIIKRAGLPTKIYPGSVEKLMRALQYDKKFLHGKNRLVLPNRIGRVRVVENIPEPLIRNVLRKGGA